MASYIGQTALTALWNKLVAILSSKADRASVYSKAEVDYKLATTYGTGSGSGGGGDYDDTLVVHKAGTETISGNKTFSGTNTFSGSNTFSSTNTFSGTPSFTSGSIILQYSSTRKVTFSTTSTQSKAYTLYVPPATATTARYLISRTAATTANQLASFADTIGTVQNSGYTVATSVSNSSTTIPTSAAVKSYVDSNSGGGGAEWYNIHAYKVTNNNGAAAVLEGFVNLKTTLTTANGYYYYLMRLHTAHSSKSWKIPYLGYINQAVDYWPLAKCRWAISTTSSITRFWGGSYTAANVFPRHSGKYTGGGYTHTFGCAIFKETNNAAVDAGKYITRVSNIAIFTLDNTGKLKISANKS